MGDTGIRISLPDPMSDEEKIQSIKDMKNIIRTFEKLTGEIGTTDFSDADKKIAELKAAPPAETAKRGTENE